MSDLILILSIQYSENEKAFIFIHFCLNKVHICFHDLIWQITWSISRQLNLPCHDPWKDRDSLQFGPEVGRLSE